MLNIVDATALERNLFLTLQLLEQNLPTVVAVNLCDQLAKKRGEEWIARCCLSVLGYR